MLFSCDRAILFKTERSKQSKGTCDIDTSPSSRPVEALPSDMDNNQVFETYTGQSWGTIVKYASHFHFLDGSTSLTL